METTVRLRLLFEDERILTDSQKSDGLDRCWILLPCHLATVSDLASHLTRSFWLHSSCPDGLILSMDEFVLPPFESTAVFKDRDLVRIWKKDVVRRDAIVEGDNNIHTEDAEVVEEQPILLCDKHLAIKDSGRELIEDLLDVAEDVDGESKEPDSDELKNSLRKIMSRKRKRLNLRKSKKVSRKIHLADLFHIARRKKVKLKKNESHAAPSVEGLANVHIECHTDNLEKSLYNNGKLPDAGHALERMITTFINENPKDVAKSNLSADRSNHHIQEEAQNDQGDPQATVVLKKFPSRSSRRKKVRRRWRRELANSEKKEMSLHERTSNQTDVKDQATLADVVKKKEFVPVVVKPGHIRFELSDEDEQAEQQKELEGTIQWNGTPDKKKGQKLGRDKTSTSEKTEKVIDKICVQEDGSEVAIDPVDFEKLCPLTGSPKVGDVVAYRLVELTSSWCPEISTFRVGRVSFFDPKTRNSILVPIPGFPVLTEKANEESEMQPGNSLYMEDGSLEIEFTSLIDVRLFKDSSPEATMATSSKIESHNEDSLANSLVSASSSGANGDLNDEAPASTGKEIVGWDEISEVLNKKKAELLQKNTASCEKVSSNAQNYAAKPSWSYRVLRGSALGPTMSLLRANNQL